MPTVDREGLLKELTFAGNDPGHAGQISGAPTNYKGDRSMGRWIADAVMVGPIFSAILAQADTAAQAVAERDEAREMRKRLDHRIYCQRLALRQTWEIVEARMGVVARSRLYRLLKERYRLLCDLHAEAARLSAEVERLRAALRDIAQEDRGGVQGIYDDGGGDDEVIQHLFRRIHARCQIARTALAAGQDKEGGKPSVPSTDAPAAAQEGKTP